jgi:hypothetical protein
MTKILPFSAFREPWQYTGKRVVLLAKLLADSTLGIFKKMKLYKRED